MSEWKTVRLSEFCRTGTGGTPSRSNLERYYEGGTIPWVKSGELRESVINETEEHVTEAALRETNMKLVPAGALLLAMYGATVGRLGILGVDATTNQAVCHIVPDPKAAEVRFLFHALSNQVANLVARGVGGAQPNISQGIVKDLKLALPPLAEQRRIAEVLDRAEALRAKRRAALAQLDSSPNPSSSTSSATPPPTRKDSRRSRWLRWSVTTTPSTTASCNPAMTSTKAFRSFASATSSKARSDTRTSSESLRQSRRPTSGHVFAVTKSS